MSTGIPKLNYESPEHKRWERNGMLLGTVALLAVSGYQISEGSDPLITLGTAFIIGLPVVAMVVAFLNPHRR